MSQNAVGGVEWAADYSAVPLTLLFTAIHELVDLSEAAFGHRTPADKAVAER